MTTIEHDSFMDPRKWFITSALLFVGSFLLAASITPSPLVVSGVQNVRAILAVAAFVMGSAYGGVGLYLRTSTRRTITVPALNVDALLRTIIRGLPLVVGLVVVGMRFPFVVTILYAIALFYMLVTVESTWWRAQLLGAGTSCATWRGASYIGVVGVVAPMLTYGWLLLESLFGLPYGTLLYPDGAAKHLGSGVVFVSLVVQWGTVVCIVAALAFWSVLAKGGNDGGERASGTI